MILAPKEGFSFVVVRRVVPGTTFMEKESLKRMFDFAVILPDISQAQQISYHYRCTANVQLDCPQKIPMYPIQSNGFFGVLTALPGYTHQAVYVLFKSLSPLVRGNTFLFSAAVSCGCVKPGINGLICIDTLYETSSSEKVELKFYLTKEAEKTYPATAISKCSHSFKNSRKRSWPQCKVQVFVTLDIPVDAIPSNTILLTLNIDKLPCSYKQADIKRLLFGNEHCEALVDAVTAFIPNIASDSHLVLPLTPPGTCKKQKLIKPMCDKEDQFINLFPCPTTNEEYAEQKKLIDDFEKDHIIAELDPNSYQHFARCLGLADVEYDHIKQDYRSQEHVHQTIRKWYSKQGSLANVKNFYCALEMHKGLQDSFKFYCKEHRKP